jgi:hypothetical protein
MRKQNQPNRFVSLFRGVSLFSFCNIRGILWVLRGVLYGAAGVSIRAGLMSCSKTTPLSGSIPFQ